MIYRFKRGGSSNQKYESITDPENNTPVPVNSKAGKNVLDNYLKFLQEKTGEKMKPEKTVKYPKSILIQIAYETINFVNMNKDLPLYKKIVKIPYV